MASSSVPSSSRPQYTYDVFLSFRGEDTRDNIVSHFHTLLAQKGINTFKDDEKLEGGEVISPQLQRAIRESRFTIVFLSKKYASSRWCLDELVEALECSNTKVYPIFYHVDPSEVRRQRGSFGEGFDELVSKQGVLGIENVQIQSWRNALEKVGNVKGWHFPSDTFRSESILIQEVVQKLFRKLYRTYGYASVAKDLVGMDSRMQKVMELVDLGMTDVRVVGIWGMGGIGKTTIAGAVYDYISWKFDGSVIKNVREVLKEYSLKALQGQLISEILMEKDLTVLSDGHAVHMIKNMVCRKKVLIVLDDVDELTDLKKLVGEHHWFCSGSRIIITTRDKHVLTGYEIKLIYEVEPLREDEATKLFESTAFEKHQEMGGYGELVCHAVKYANGVPLALEVLGSLLRGKNIDEWKCSLNKLKESPLPKVQGVLRISYDALDWRQKQIFLDIACFFKGKDKNDVTKILESCGFHAFIGIKALVEKSLITIAYNELLMHHLIQEMGQCIVDEQSRIEPGERSRLWRDEDVKHVLMDNTGTNKVEGIFMQYGNLRGLDPKDIRFLKQLKLRPKAFEKMSNLRILKICYMHLSKDLKYLSNNLRYLDWLGYPMKYMPSTFQPKHLVELHLTYSRIEQLWKGTMHLGKLRIMNLSHSTYLTKSPCFFGVPNLKRLILEGCTGLVNLHASIGVLRRLICLNLKDCKSLKSLPDSVCQLKRLGTLILSGCSKLDKLPQDLGGLDCLYELYADWTAIRQLPSSIGRLKNLEILRLQGCKGLSSNSWSSFLPFILRRERDMESYCNLLELDLSYCNLKSIPTAICHIYSLLDLQLRGNNMESLPPRMNRLSRLQELDLSDCKKLQELPEFSSGIRNLYAEDCSSLRTICNPSKYNNFEALHFNNCFKLIENKQNSILTEKFLSILVQRHASTFFAIHFPGKEIPKWFRYQSWGSSMSFQLPPHWFNNNFLGVAFAAVGLKKGELAHVMDEVSIRMLWKCHVTQRIIKRLGLLAHAMYFGNILVMGAPRGEFLPFTEDCMEELNEGGIEFELSVHSIPWVNAVNKLPLTELVEKVGVHFIYEEAEEQAVTSRYNSQDNNNINIDVFHGDLDRSAGVQVGSSSSSATTSKRRRDDDLNDNHYDAAAGASRSPGIDDQEDHLNNLNSKRLRMDTSHVLPTDGDDAWLPATEPTSNKRKGRGSTTLPDVIKDRSYGVRKAIDYNENDQLIRNNSIKCSSYHGLLACVLIPICYKDWFDVPAELKEKLWSCVELTDKVDERSKKNVLSLICSKWRTFKKELAKYIRENKSNPEIISNPPAIYGFIERRHWDSFLVRRLSKEFEILRQVQKWRQSQNKYNYRISRKGYARFQEDYKRMTGSTENLDRSVLWKKARQNKSGEYDEKTITEQAARIGKPCKLAIDSIENIVAHGTVYERIEHNEAIHTVPLEESNVRVSVEVVIQKDAPLPVPIPDEMLIVGEAVGFFVAWPKNLVLVGDEGASINVECEKYQESIQSFVSLVEHIKYDEAIDIPLEKDIFGEEINIQLQRVDMEYICHVKELSVTCIMLYISHLHQVLKASNWRKQFVFVNPCVVSGTTMVGKKSKSVLLARRLEEAMLEQLILIPYNIGYHWILLVIDLRLMIVYLLDPINSKINTSFEIVINDALKIYETTQRRQTTNPVWKVVQSPQQPTNVECGFYVMRYMKDLIRDQSILRKQNFNGKKTYTETELDEVRVEWINFAVKNMS